MGRRRVAMGALAVLALAAGACGSNDDTSSGPGSTGSMAPAGGGRVGATDSLVLGLLVPESGDLSVIVNSLAKPTQLAVQQINDAGGVNGKPVRIEQRDDGSGAQTTSVSFDALVDGAKITALVGPASSASARGLIDKLKSRGVTACSGSTTAADLTKADSGGYFFRTAPGDDLQGPALAEVVVADNHTRVAVLARNDDYGTGFARSLEEGLRSSGATVVESVAYDPGGSNFDGDVRRVLAAQPEAVVVLGFNDDGGKVVKALIAQGAGPAQKPIYTADGMQSSKFFEAVDAANPDAIKGIKGTAPAGSPSGVESPYVQPEGVDPIFSAYYWDCTNLLALAAHKAKANDSTAMKDAFASNLSGENDCNDFASCKKFLDEGKTIHYRGASNRFDTWNKVEPGSGAYEIWAYGDGGKYSTLPVPQIKV